MAFTQLIFAEISEMAYLSPYFRMTTTKTYAKTMIGSIPDINPIGNFIGEPEYREIKSIIPSKNNLLRPEQEKQKEKIREKY